MEAILISSLLTLKILFDRISLGAVIADRLTAAAILMVLGTAALTTALSTNQSISVMSLGYVIACVIVFSGTYAVAASQTLTGALIVGSGSAIVNALLAVSQRLNWWNPFLFEEWLPQRTRTTALIGNPNDVGAYLAICTIPFLASVVVRRRPLEIAMSATLLIGVVAADALTAMIAVLAAGMAMLLSMPRRIALSSATVLLVVAIGAVSLLPPLRARMMSIVKAARSNNYDALTSHRIVGFHAAWKMFLDRPLTGVGPGTFKWHYLPYRVRVELDHPEYYLKSQENQGEVHSDHLQVLAEEGLVGYAVLLFGAGLVGSRSWVLRSRGQRQDDRVHFARVVALPLMVSFLVLAAAGFPLELTAVIQPLLFFVACILRWSHNAAMA